MTPSSTSRACATFWSARAGGDARRRGLRRSTGRPGVVLVTSGPGATNAVTRHRRCADGFGSPGGDQRPGADHLIGTDAFQECDTVGITRSCTKHNYLVKDAAELPHILTRPFISPPTAGRVRC